MAPSREAGYALQREVIHMTFRYKVGWTGGRIGAGVSVFNLGIAGAEPVWASVNTAFRDWYQALAPSIPNDVILTFPFESESFDPATGELQEVVSIPQAASVQGTDSNTSWSASAGRVVRWSTGVVVSGRRLYGKTFIVPSGAGAFSEGSVNSGTRGTDQTAHAALLNALEFAQANLMVYSRTHGVAEAVQGGATLARPTTLRSRND